ncbi:hypothetical protein BDF22DRAFT_683370, partial [Syncephalis plumigaleata]
MNKLLSIMLISCVYTIIQILVYTNAVDVCDVQQNVSLSLSLSSLFTFDYVLRNHLYVYRIVFSPSIAHCCITHFHAVVSLSI